MTAQASQKTEVKWDQSGFDAWQATLPPERIAEDEKLLKEIFNLASRSPTLKQALDWAGQHGIKFFVDRTTKSYHGQYKNGMGVVAIAAFEFERPEKAISTITHEIRHAWQDYYGLISNGSTVNFSKYYTQTALIEADANAFGERAESEFLAAGSPHSLTYETTDLGIKFLSWFSSVELPLYYGTVASEYIGQWLGVVPASKSPPGNNFSQGDSLKTLYPLGAGVDVSDIENVLKLGKGFAGEKSYLAALPKEVLLKNVLAPSIADTFYGAASDNQRKLTADIRKAYLRKTLKPARNT